jgi:hypothetical protein
VHFRVPRYRALHHVFNVEPIGDLIHGGQPDPEALASDETADEDDIGPGGLIQCCLERSTAAGPDGQRRKRL